VGIRPTQSFRLDFLERLVATLEECRSVRTSSIENKSIAAPSIRRGGGSANSVREAGAVEGVDRLALIVDANTVYCSSSSSSRSSSSRAVGSHPLPPLVLTGNHAGHWRTLAPTSTALVFQQATLAFSVA